MNITTDTHPLTLERRVVITITDAELKTMRLYPFDRALLDDCESDDATIADKLLGLELIARRIEEPS